MKTIFKAAALTATILGTSAALPTAALAQAAAPQSAIIIVDIDRVLTASAAGRGAQAELKTKADGVQSRFTSLQNQFRTEEEQLLKARQSNSMAPEALQAKLKDLQTRSVNANNEINNRQRDLANSVGYVRQQILNGANPIVQALMRERGAQVVLEKGATLISNPALDVTNEVIARLDKSLPRVSTTPPAQTSQNTKK